MPDDITGRSRLRLSRCRGLAAHVRDIERRCWRRVQMGVAPSPSSVTCWSLYSIERTSIQKGTSTTPQIQKQAKTLVACGLGWSNFVFCGQYPVIFLAQSCSACIMLNRTSGGASPWILLVICLMACVEAIAGEESMKVWCSCLLFCECQRPVGMELF